ncbi:hypothetical protein BDF14DRAFT_1697581, partial [Spinellus fusiger]
PGMDKDFFCRPIDEITCRCLLLNCPRNVLRQYQPPSLNYTDVGSFAKCSDGQL